MTALDTTTTTTSVRRGAALRAAGRRTSTRQLRSDVGKPKGPPVPRLEPNATTSIHNGAEVAHIALGGIHGTGRTLALDARDWQAIRHHFEGGRRVNVVDNGLGDVCVRLNGPAAARWAGNDNPKHQITVARFITGERRRTHQVRFRDHNPFNLVRSNLLIEARRDFGRMVPDWTEAERNREAATPALAVAADREDERASRDDMRDRSACFGRAW